MGYDLYPLTTLETRKKWLPRAARENWTVVFGHDAHTPVVRPRSSNRTGRSKPYRPRYSQIARIIECRKTQSPQSKTRRTPPKLESSAAAASTQCLGCEIPREVRIKTPFGDPSDALILGKLEGRNVAFLARTAADIAFSPLKLITARIFAP